MRWRLDSDPADFVHFMGEGDRDFAEVHGLGLYKDRVDSESDAHAFHTAHGVRFLQLVVRQRLDVAGVHNDLRLLRKIE